MHWTEPATADDSHAALEKKLWFAANQLWSNAALKPSEYSPTVLGLIFLRYADVRFAAVEAEMKPLAGSRRKISPTDFDTAGANVGQEINKAMRTIEKLPKSYHILESRTLASLLKTKAIISKDISASTHHC